MKKKQIKKQKHTDLADVTVPTVNTKVSTKRTNKKKVVVVQEGKQSHAEFNLQKINKTYPADPEILSVSELTGDEIGDPGTRNINGIIQEEYNAKLNGIQGIKIYDEMRKSDGTVRAIVLATTLPIRKAIWRVEPASEEDADVEVADFVQKNLFELMDTTWSDFIRQALLMLPFGVMPFEKVYEPMTVDGKDMIILKKLAARMPKTIYRWMLNDGTLGFQQQRQDGVLAEIPMDKAIVFVNEMEGSNWWGMSYLRAAYKHWFIKNNLYKIDAIGLERQSIGVPKVKLPVGATDSDKKAAQNILMNLRANENQYVIEPNTYEVTFMDMMAHSVRDVNPSIMHHNREISKSVLAQFLELGASTGSGGTGGSHALSKDHSELFLQAEEAVAESIMDRINKDLIPQLVDLNYDVEDYPKIEFTGITEVDVSSLATAYQTLINSGGIKSLENDEMFFRDIMDLPELTAEEVAKREQQEQENISRGLNPDGSPIPIIQPDKTHPPDANLDPNAPPNKKDKQSTGGGGNVKEQDVVQEAEMTEQFNSFKKKRSLSEDLVKNRIETKLAKMTTPQRWVFVNQMLRKIERLESKPQTSRFFFTLKKVLTIKKDEMQRMIFRDNNDFEGWRKITMAEKKVDLGGIQDMMSSLEDELITKTNDYLSGVKEDYIKRLAAFLHADDIVGAGALEMSLQNEYRDIVKSIMMKAYVYGKTNASKEIGTDTPSNPQDILDIINVAADNIAKSHFQDLTSQAKLVMTEQLAKSMSAAQVVGMVDKALSDVIDSLTGNTARIVVAGSLNQGRMTTFQDNLENVYAAQRSEILDLRTCAYCLSLDGRIVSKDDPFFQNTIFHSGCRGIWVLIMNEEVDKPDISGIPQSLRNRFGGAINELSQPKKPLVKKDSLASKFLNGL